jgi:hypothetical protein
MSIAIRKLAQSIITAQAVAGGDLLADTTYYVCCVWNMTTAFRDGDAHSDFTNEVEVLTTSVNKSIEINYDWTVNIAEFSDFGSGGYVNVKCDELHCMLNTNSVDISGTSNYDGTYDVYYDIYSDDPDTFRILHSWDGDDATGTATCDDNVIGSCNYISVRCAVTTAYLDGEPWQARMASNNWIGPGYSAPPAVQGYTVTSQPTGSGSYAGSVMPRWRKDSMPKGITYYGRPYADVVTYETWNNIIAYITTWLPTSSNLSLGTAQQIERFYFMGHLRFTSLTTLITITNKDVTIDGAIRDANVANGIEYVQFKYCLFKSMGTRRPTITGTFLESVIRSENQDGPNMHQANVIDCMLLPSSNYTFYGTGSEQIDGATMQLNSKSRYFWYVYPRNGTRVQNLELREGYFYIYSTNFNWVVDSDNHPMENINIFCESTTRDIYMYQPSGDYQMEVLNVRAPNQANGIPRVLRHVNYKENNDIYFFFSVALHVVDAAGDLIVGATVKMVDKDSNEVSDDTDGNGDVLLKVKSYENINNPTDEYGTYEFYSPFVLTIEKDGYQVYTEAGIDLYDKIDKTIALQGPEVIYIPETIINSAELYDTIIY